MKVKKSIGGKSLQLWVIVFVLIIGAFALLKAEVLNKPRKTPKEITQMMVDFTQKDKPSDQDKTEMRKYVSQSLLDKWNSNESTSSDSSSSSSSDKPVITIQNVEENGSSATATLEISASILKIPVQYKFTKEGNFWKGYKWMISDLVGFGSSDSSTDKKESTTKAGEKATIGDNWSLIVSQLSEYTSNNQFEKPDDGMRFVAVELQYFNDATSSDTVDPTNLTLRDSDGHSYDTTYMATKEPALDSSTTVTPSGTVKGFVTYEISAGAKITSAIYSNSYVNLTVNF